MVLKPALSQVNKFWNSKLISSLQASSTDTNTSSNCSKYGPFSGSSMITSIHSTSGAVLSSTSTSTSQLDSLPKGSKTETVIKWFPMSSQVNNVSLMVVTSIPQASVARIIKSSASSTPMPLASRKTLVPAQTKNGDKLSSTVKVVVHTPSLP